MTTDLITRANESRENSRFLYIMKVIKHGEMRSAKYGFSEFGNGGEKKIQGSVEGEAQKQASE